MRRSDSMKGWLLLAFGTWMGAASAVETADSFQWRTDCVGRFALNLPGGVEVAGPVIKAFATPKEEPNYPTQSARDFVMAYDTYHFSDDPEGSSFTPGTWGSTQYVGGGVASGPRADEAEFARYRKLMDTVFGNKKLSLKRSYRSSDVENSEAIHPMAPDLPNAHIWGWGESKYYLLWRDGRLFSSQAVLEDADFIRHVSDHIRSREVFDVPKEPGVCLHYAFLPDDGTLPRRVAITYRLKDHPELEIYFADNKGERDPPKKLIQNFWEYRHPFPGPPQIRLLSPHFPGVVEFPEVRLAGYPGQSSFVEIRHKDGSTDYGYLAYVQGDPQAQEDRPDLMLYVISTVARASGKPLSRQQIEGIAEHIAASIRRR